MPAAERRPLRRAGRGAGFTLVELLVSMVVLALVAIVITGGLRFVLRAFANTAARSTTLDETILGLAVLRGELERAEPLMLKVRNEQFVLFDGTADRLRFINVTPPFKGGPPYLAYEYAITLDAGRYRLELRRAPLDPARPDLVAAAGAGESRVLLEVGRPLQFTYFGQRRQSERPAWYAEWRRAVQLPRAVRLAENEEPGWPELLVPLQIGAPWYCGGGGDGSGEAGDGNSGIDPGDATASGDAARISDAGASSSDTNATTGAFATMGAAATRNSSPTAGSSSTLGDTAPVGAMGSATKSAGSGRETGTAGCEPPR